MKVLLFTHNDLDGIGNAILAKLCYKKDDLDCIICIGSDVNSKLKECLNSNILEKYDKIYITDLGPNLEIMNLIDSLPYIKNKLTIFDHHISRLEIGYNNFDFCNIIVKNEQGLCCGTSLFFEYLVKNNILIPNNCINEFVELVRQYDTWEWRNIYNNNKASDLNCLHNIYGTDTFINIITKKLKTDDTLEFTDVDMQLLQIEKNRINIYTLECLESMVTREICGGKAGLIFSELYINDITDYMTLNYKALKLDLDYIIFINLKTKYLYYRSLNGFPSYKVAINYGGGGNAMTGGSLIKQNKLEDILNILFEL